MNARKLYFAISDAPAHARGLRGPYILLPHHRKMEGNRNRENQKSTKKQDKRQILGKNRGEKKRERRKRGEKEEKKRKEEEKRKRGEKEKEKREKERKGEKRTREK